LELKIFLFQGGGSSLTIDRTYPNLRGEKRKGCNKKGHSLEGRTLSQYKTGGRKDQLDARQSTSRKHGRTSCPLIKFDFVEQEDMPRGRKREKKPLYGEKKNLSAGKEVTWKQETNFTASMGGLFREGEGNTTDPRNGRRKGKITNPRPSSAIIKKSSLVPLMEPGFSKGTQNRKKGKEFFFSGEGLPPSTSAGSLARGQEKKANSSENRLLY